MNIYIILLCLGIIGAMMLNLSADIAIQISQYDFGSNTARISWYKDALLSGGIGIIVTVLLIFSYNEVQNMNIKSDNIKRGCMPIKELRSLYKMFLYNLYHTFMSINGKNKIKLFDFISIKSEKIYDELFNELFYKEITRTNLKATSTIDNKSIFQALSFYIKELNEDVKDKMKIVDAYIPSKLVNEINELPSKSLFVSVLVHEVRSEACPSLYLTKDEINGFEDTIKEICTIIKKLEKLLPPEEN